MIFFTTYFVRKLTTMSSISNKNEVYRIGHKKAHMLKPVPPPKLPFKIMSITPPTPSFEIMSIPHPPPMPSFKMSIPPPPSTPSFEIMSIPPPPPTPSFEIMSIPSPPPPTPSFENDWNNIEKRFIWVKKRWEILKKQHNLEGWSFCFNSRLRTTAGQCLYGKNKRVELATLLINSHDIRRDDVLDTLLHEVAHAIAGYEAAHGPKWKKIAKQIGCSGNVCHSISFGQHKVAAFLDCSVDCPNNHTTLFRIPSRYKNSRVLCGMCDKKINLLVCK